MQFDLRRCPSLTIDILVRRVSDNVFFIICVFEI